MKMMKQINLNDDIKVKLNPFGVDIFYHQYDELNEKIIKRGGKPLERRMPQIDKDGYTSFRLWQFMELYGSHISAGCKLPCETNMLVEVKEDEE